MYVCICIMVRGQSWGSYFENVIYYIYSTDYFLGKVIYYGYILLLGKSNLLYILLYEFLA